MKITKEKLATWSFPIFVIMCVTSVLLYFGIKFSIGFYKENVVNGKHRVRVGNITIKYPCKPKKSELIQYGCIKNDVTYDASSYSQSNSSNICKKPDYVVETVPNEDVSYQKTFNGLVADICIQKSNTERGINSGYRGVIARIKFDNEVYSFEVKGNAQYYDYYSDLMEKFLGTVKRVES